MRYCYRDSEIDSALLERNSRELELISLLSLAESESAATVIVVVVAVVHHGYVA